MKHSGVTIPGFQCCNWVRCFLLRPHWDRPCFSTHVYRCHVVSFANYV